VKARYAVEYGHCGFGEPSTVIGVWYTRAYDASHALERFYEHDDDGFMVFRVAKVPEGLESLSHRWSWQECPNGGDYV
jgi:hypothetical protein